MMMMMMMKTNNKVVRTRNVLNSRVCGQTFEDSYQSV
jgi:hypothetical protein